MLIGAHVSAAGDLTKAPERAKQIGCECFQFFSRSPRGGSAKEISDEQAEKFKKLLKDYDMECYIHTPYYINLASAKNKIYFGSINVLRDELERGSRLGVRYVMTHLGSAKDLGREKAIEKVVSGLANVLNNYKGRTKLLLENSAGAGEIIGDDFNELAKIVNNKKIKKYNIGICFDTAHAFASGYDLRTSKDVDNAFLKIKNQIGKDKIKLIHANDSKTDLNENKDRHEHIGKGKIGKVGWQATVAYFKNKNINYILETPTEEGMIKDIKYLKKLRDKK